VKEAIREKALELGFDACRFTSAQPPPHAAEFQSWIASGQHGAMGYLERNAPKRANPELVLPGAKSIIVLAASYAPGQPMETNLSKVGRKGLIARYARFKDYHDVLGERLKPLAAFVNSCDGASTRSLWYVDTGPVLERDLAQRAGLGFAGKHTNLISRALGNWFFLAEILTTAELAPDEPEKNRCGSCARCIPACPTGAIIAPFQLDARRCISYLTIELKGSIPEELRPLMGRHIYGCDLCLEACPWNRFARESQLLRPHRRADLDEPQLLELLALDEAAFLQKFAGTPLLRAKRRGLLRNVCVALGNTGGPDCLPALERASQDPEPLIAEHARWAVEQIAARQDSFNPHSAESSLAPRVGEGED